MQPRASSGGAHAGGTGDDEAPKDPGARITHQSYTEKDYEGKNTLRMLLSYFNESWTLTFFFLFISRGFCILKKE